MTLQTDNEGDDGRWEEYGDEEMVEKENMMEEEASVNDNYDDDNNTKVDDDDNDDSDDDDDGDSGADSGDDDNSELSHDKKVMDDDDDDEDDGDEDDGDDDTINSNDKNDNNETNNIEEDDDDDENGEEEDDDIQSFVTNRTSDSRQDYSTKGSSKSFPSHIPDHLDRRTLEGIKSYLNSFEAKGALDEDEIVQLMLKADRNVEHRSKYFTNPLDDILDEDKMHKDFYNEEEDYLVGHDFMKEMTTALQGKRKRGVDKRTINWVKRASGLNRKDYHSRHSALGHDAPDSDDQDGKGEKIGPRRYTRGMARTTRIKRKEEFIFKDNLGLKSLLNVIEEMEPASGPYPVPFECQQKSRQSDRDRDRNKAPLSGSSSRIISRKIDRGRHREMDWDSKTYSKGRDDNVIGRPLVARLPEEEVIDNAWRRDYIFGDNRDFLVTRVWVNGEHVEEDEEDKMTMKERKAELKRMRDRQYQKRKRDRKLREKEQRNSIFSGDSKYTTPLRSNATKCRREYGSDADEDNEERHRPRKHRRSTKKKEAARARMGALKGPINLSLLDWQRRQMWANGKWQKKDAERDAGDKVEIPVHMSKTGVGHRLPSWESVNPASNVWDKSNQAELAPARGRHSDEVYASWSHKLINLLNGGARSWAMYEFFYSDIDRAWYNSNPFAIEVAKLGILPSAKLTRREWSVVRRMMHRRPRRFSKHFISSQIEERNTFREMVRDLQRNPDKTNHTEYTIPAQIKVGATVTAYSTKFLVLHRGIVLFHDVFAGRYLVQFERKELGFEFCRDTEVATHGVPDILMSPSRTKLTGSPLDGGIDDCIRIGTEPYGTSFGPECGVKRKESITCEKDVANLLSKTKRWRAVTPGDDSESARFALVEKVAERETLVTLMETIEAATQRKSMLLDVMEVLNILLVDRLPFGEGPPSNHVLSGYFEQHYAWLRANLQVTNQSIDNGYVYLRVMYGEAYKSTPVSEKNENEKLKKMFVETVLSKKNRLCGGPPMAAMPWIGALQQGSGEVGTFLSTLLFEENDLPGQIPINASSHGSLDNSHARRRIASAGSILSAIGYCCGRSEESDVTLPEGDPPLIDVVLAAGLGDLAIPEVSTLVKDDALEEVLAERAAAEKQLREAFEMLSSEFSNRAVASRLI